MGLISEMTGSVGTFPRVSGRGTRGRGMRGAMGMQVTRGNPLTAAWRIAVANNVERDFYAQYQARLRRDRPEVLEPGQVFHASFSVRIRCRRLF